MRSACVICTLLTASLVVAPSFALGASALTDTDSASVAQYSSKSKISQIPFTGYGIAPLLLVGVAVLAGGFVLRRAVVRRAVS